MNRSYNNENDENLDLFTVYEDEIDKNVTYKYHRKLFSQKSPDDPLNEINLYDVKFSNNERIELPVPKSQYEEEPRRHLPKWIRKEMKNDKKAWKQIHRNLKQTPKYQPEYFSPLPEVEHVQPNYEQYNKYLNYQSDEKNSNSQNSEEKESSQGSRENSNLRINSEYSNSQSIEDNSNE